jgi:hypothetical protein
MSALTVFVLVLWIVGVLGLFAQAFGAAFGRVSPGWLGLALIALAALLTDLPG